MPVSSMTYMRCGFGGLDVSDSPLMPANSDCVGLGIKSISAKHNGSFVSASTSWPVTEPWSDREGCGGCAHDHVTERTISSARAPRTYPTVFDQPSFTKYPRAA